MKKIFLKTALSIACLAIVIFSCKKQIDSFMPIDAYTYSGLDAGGGTWKTFLLTGGDQVSVAVPTDVASAAYVKELADLKSGTTGLSKSQKTAVAYWGTNSLIRWNEIASEMAAKYNLPPAPNDDGTYSTPDAANPGNYPKFPFAHPPYACRMYAYWGAAQFDALIDVWYQKYKYKRPAPYKTDGTITTLLPQNDLPSYPSEDAAIAAVSEVILTAMFPLEKDVIKQKSDELKNARLWAGMNVPSDIAAGDSIGRAVAAVFISRSKTDGMKNANTNVAGADSLKNAAQAKWGWHWENLDFPQRRVGILPNFGKVKPWFIADIATVRPGPPPAPGSDEFNTAVQELKQYDKKLSDDKRDIAFYWADGPGTYTPPGHWNRISYSYIINQKLNPLRTARVFAYTNMAVMDAGISCWDTKYYYHYPRPSGADPSVKTNIGIPNFPSYISGHSAFSGAACQVLSHFFPEGQGEFERLAREATESRIYARIHYRFDSETGLTVGKNVGTYAVNAAKIDGGD